MSEHIPLRVATLPNIADGVPMIARPAALRRHRASIYAGDPS